MPAERVSDEIQDPRRAVMIRTYLPQEVVAQAVCSTRPDEDVQWWAVLSTRLQAFVDVALRYVPNTRSRRFSVETKSK